MKIKPRCIPCEIEGAYEQIKLSTENEKLRFEALRKVLDYLHSASSKNITPTEIGTERNRIIRETTSNQDPYREIKKEMNETAMEMKPIAKKYIESGNGERERMKKAVKVAAIGNSFDFSVSEHSVNLSDLKEKFRETLKEGIYHDDTELVVSKILESNHVIYLLDNPGEAVLDKFLLKSIRKTNSKKTIIVGARSAPVQDDITIEMAKELELQKLGKLLPSGRTTGFNPAEAPEEISEAIKNTDLVLSKGQGNYELLSEYENRFRGRLAYLLMGKCGPVSNSLNVRRGSTVVYFVQEE